MNERHEDLFYQFESICPKVVVSGMIFVDTIAESQLLFDHFLHEHESEFLKCAPVHLFLLLLFVR